jgi:hypothetical protein
MGIGWTDGLINARAITVSKVVDDRLTFSGLPDLIVNADHRVI